MFEEEKLMVEPYEFLQKDSVTKEDPKNVEVNQDDRRIPLEVIKSLEK